MSYYGAGDYYGAGGIGSFLKKAAGAAIGFVTGGPLGAVRAVLPTTTSAQAPMPSQQLQVPPGPHVGPMPGIIPAIQRIVPGGATGLMHDRRSFTKDGRPRRIRKDGRPWGIPSMDPGNTKALRRAARRMDRFVGIARTALQHTKYGVYTRSSRSSKRKR